MQLQPFIRTSNIAKTGATVLKCALRNKSNCDSHFAVGPNFSDLRLDLENIVLEQKHVVVDGFSDVFVFAG
jgi:hypothetical protein